MNIDLSILNLVLEASLVVQVVILILLISSVISWMFIFAKGLELKLVLLFTKKFEKKFFGDDSLMELYKKLSADRYKPKGLEKIFLRGYKEFSMMRQQGDVAASVLIDSAQRAMRIELTKELDELDKSLPFLATVGSTSPYIGLFGTVWGIMNAFQALVHVQQATLTQVAPGIAEALIATAVGLFAAIPSVIAYNRFSTRVDRIASRHEIFIDEFVNRLHRLAHK
ncbi:MAG: protein TolQ [Methylococcales bacterium]|nr:protein TolQ [Methylococcales bacterium]MCK5924968.1 protein TolQ [Methylococcales bacterium]